MLKQTDHDAIAAAVTAAEAKTSGEIVCVLARQVSSYREVPLAAAAATALLAPAIALAVGFDPLTILSVTKSWTAAQSSAIRSTLDLAVAAYAIGQVALFALAAGVASITPIRRMLTPTFLKRRRVRQAAMQQLASASLAAGPGRAAVVIFASEDDRRVEVLANEAIHAKTGALPWDGAVKAVLTGMKTRNPTQGFVQAVAICGQAMTEHFPGGEGDGNAIPDGLLEI